MPQAVSFLATSRSLLKKRLDLLLVEKGLVSSRARAQGLILAGQVLVNDVPETKPGHTISDQATLRIRGQEHPYVSRGGLKLEAALRAFSVSLIDAVALDVGASTGGFTQVLLLNGVQRVYAIDVGHSQLDWSLRSHPQVVVKEKLNARYLTYEQIGELVDCIVMDVSFISVEKILPSLQSVAKPSAHWIILVKPQFEVGKGKLGKGGIVSSEADRQEVLNRVTAFAKTLGLERQGLIDSPIKGADGNQEYLLYLRQTGP